MYKVLKINRLFTIHPLFFTICFCFLAITGCKEAHTSSPISGQGVKLDFAENFELEHFDNFYKLSIKVFFHGDKASSSNVKEYILYSGDSSAIPSGFDNLKKIKVPVNRIVSLSGNYYAYLKGIGQESKVVGFGNKNFTADPALYEAIEKGIVKDVGNGPTLSEEAVYSLHPDVVLTFATGTGFDSDLTKLSSAGIPVLLLSEWQESSALGRLEWIKLFELLTTGSFEGDLNEASDDHSQKFNLYKIEKAEYEKIRDSVEQFPCIKTLVGAPYSGTWFAPGKKSFTGTLLSDARGCSVFTDDKTNLKLDLQTAFSKAKEAEIWINAGPSQEALIANESRIQILDVFKSGNVYYYDKLTGPSGALDFFEKASVYPSKALHDFVIMLHGTKEEQKSLTWYRNIFYN